MTTTTLHPFTAKETADAAVVVHGRSGERDYRESVRTFRGILIGFVLVAPPWLVILYFVLRGLTS